MSTKFVAIEYLQDLEKYKEEKPFNLSFSKYHDGITTNVEKEERIIQIHDIRGRESDFTCEKNSFRFLKFPTRYPVDGTELRTFQYLEEARQMLKREFVAEEVICYDIRRRCSDALDLREDKKPQAGYFGALEDVAPPVYNVHIDHTLQGGLERIKRHLTPNESAKYLAPGWRVRIVNIWRPLNPVVTAPLAVCDSSTLHMADLVETDQVNESWYGEIYLVKFNAEHRFYWLKDQSPDEVCLMLMFDSHNGEPERNVHYPEGAENAPARESVEVRAIIFNKLPDHSSEYSE